jgi:hypothetical protein
MRRSKIETEIIYRKSSLRRVLQAQETIVLSIFSRATKASIQSHKSDGAAMRTQNSVILHGGEDDGGLSRDRGARPRDAAAGRGGS